MKILICVPVFNRKKITELVLHQLNKHKQDATLWVYNDWSKDYDNDFLIPLCDKVFKLPPSKKIVIKNESNKNGMGVQHLRWYQFREFVKMKDYDALYFTDSDALHDPNYINALKAVYDFSTKIKPTMPICLYSTKWHMNSTIKHSKDFYIRQTAPGISQFYTRDMCEKIVKKLNLFNKQHGDDPDYGWDYAVSSFLQLPFLTTKMSYVEHFGVEGMHTPSKNYSDFERDRALNPSTFLKNTRNDVIQYLMSKNEDNSQIIKRLNSDIELFTK